MSDPSKSDLTDEALSTHGLIAHHAALADSLLFEIFHHFSGCKREMSRAIYFTLDALTGRITLVQRTAVVAHIDKETLAMIDALGTAVRAIASHRNSFAHSFLVMHRGLGDDHLKIINPKGKAPPGGTRVTGPSLKKARDDSADHLKKCTKAFQVLCQKLGIRPEVSL